MIRKLPLRKASYNVNKYFTKPREALLVLMKKREQSKPVEEKPAETSVL